MTDIFEAPTLNREIVCISDDAALAAAVCFFVGEANEYVPILIGPRMQRPDASSEVARLCNWCAKVNPAFVVLAGMGSEAAGAIRATRPDFAFLTVDSVADARDQLSRFRRRPLQGVLRCRANELAKGLLKAKRTGQLLVVDNEAHEVILGERNGGDGGHIVVLDDHDPMAQVIGATYAFSLAADLSVIPEREDTVRDQVYQDIDERSRQRNDERGRRALASLASLQASLEPTLRFGQREFVTFITRGIPYGYFYRDAPSTHLLSYPNLGGLIIAGVYSAHATADCMAAVLLDPGDFPQSETAVLTAALGESGTVVEVVAGAEATVDRALDYISAYPYDLLFICSHCGELPGTLWEIEWRDPEGQPHIVEFEETIAFGANALVGPQDGLVTVNVLVRPLTIDGVSWHSAGPDLNRHCGDIWRYLLETRPNERRALTSAGVQHAKFTTAIKLSDRALMLASVRTTDVKLSPIVFNNACVSYYDAALALTFAGARSYVGTLSAVRTRAAQQLAETVFTGREREESLPLALWRAQHHVFDDPDDRTYVHVGCHFNTIRPPHQDASVVVKQRVSEARRRWADHAPQHPCEATALIRRFVSFLSGFPL